MVSLVIHLVATCRASRTGEKRLDKLLQPGFFVHFLLHVAIFVAAIGTTYLASRLHTDGEGERLGRIGAEVQVFVVVGVSGCDELVLEVIAVFLPLLVESLEVAHLAAYLHPAAGEGNVAEIGKPGSDTGHRANVAREAEVAAA